MIIDYKYHIASLVAVFLALGIGILIGSTLLGNSTLVDYQKQVTDRLESQLQELREENKVIEAKASTLEIDQNVNRQFEEQVMPILVAGLLNGKHYALVDFNSVGFPPELTEVITEAGGKICSVSAVNTFYDQSRTLVELKQDMGRQDMKDEEFIKMLGADMAAWISTGEEQETITYLEGRDLLKRSGNYGLPLDGVLLVGGSYLETKRELQLDLAFIDYFKEMNIPIIGLEETDVVDSSMKEYQRKHISTVDNIDTAPGRLSVVLALSGQPGHYGVKATAQQLMPDLGSGS